MASSLKAVHEIDDVVVVVVESSVAGYLLAVDDVV